jgi:acetyl esterase/lipase
LPHDVGAVARARCGHFAQFVNHAGKLLRIICWLLLLAATLCANSVFAQQKNPGDQLKEFLDELGRRARQPQQGSNAQRPAAPKAPDEVEYLPDITYTKAGGVELQLDIAMPKEGAGPFPAIVCVHGGGWHSGSRKSYTPVIWECAKRGYVGVTVSYRFAPQHKFPAQIEDVKAAVRWLRANAAKYKIDPDRIGATGGSAGGHLVGLLGVTSKEDKLEGNGGHLDQSSRVQAVAPMFGGFDLTVAWEHAPKQPPLEAAYLRKVGEDLIGGLPSAKPDVWKAASPITYVTKDDPPFLLIHGTADTLVPLEQSELMEKKLKESGVPVELMRVQGAGHGFKGKELEDVGSATFEFFNKHLKGVAQKSAPQKTSDADAKSAPPIAEKTQGDAPTVTWTKNVQYSQGGQIKLRMDIVRPAKTEKPLPFVVFIHGGSYRENGREGWHDEAAAVAEAGYVCATIHYRGPPVGQYAASIEDCKAAIRFLRANAKEYGIDPTRGALYGDSMGGWAALLTGLTQPKDGFEGNGGNKEQSSAVQAIVARYPITDLTDAQAYSVNKGAPLIFLAMTGTTDTASPEARKASPINYIDANDPPVLLFHTRKDQVVPFSQSEKLRDALKAAGVKVEFHELSGGWHASERRPASDADKQDFEMCRRASIEFLDKHLKK